VLKKKGIEGFRPVNLQGGSEEDPEKDGRVLEKEKGRSRCQVFGV